MPKQDLHDGLFPLLDLIEVPQGFAAQVHQGTVRISATHPRWLFSCKLNESAAHGFHIISFRFAFGAGGYDRHPMPVRSGPGHKTARSSPPDVREAIGEF